MRIKIVMVCLRTIAAYPNPEILLDHFRPEEWKLPCTEADIQPRKSASTDAEALASLLLRWREGGKNVPGLPLVDEQDRTILVVCQRFKYTAHLCDEGWQWVLLPRYVMDLSLDKASLSILLQPEVQPFLRGVGTLMAAA